MSIRFLVGQGFRLCSEVMGLRETLAGLPSQTGLLTGLCIQAGLLAGLPGQVGLLG